MTTETITHADMTKNIRTRVKRAGISARVNKSTICGENRINVITPKYDSRFTTEELATILTIAKINGLTIVHGGEIKVSEMSQLTGRNEFTFVYTERNCTY